MGFFIYKMSIQNKRGYYVAIMKTARKLSTGLLPVFVYSVSSFNDKLAIIL